MEAGTPLTIFQRLLTMDEGSKLATAVGGMGSRHVDGVAHRPVDIDGRPASETT